MAKNSVPEWDETQTNNTDIGGTNIDEGCASSGMNDAVRKIMAQLKAFFKSSVFRLWDGTDNTKRLAFDLSSLTTGTTRTLKVQDRSGTIAMSDSTDTRRNRLVNHDKLVSQENGQTAGTTNGRYPSDQNAMYFVSSAGTFTGVNVAGRTSPKGGNRDRITITTADTSLAAGEFLTYTQNIEGSNVADLKWGTADAVPVVLRRGFNFPEGTWTVAFHNSAANRSYVTTFTVSSAEANTDIVREFAIPGDTIGTWLTADGVIGITMDVVIGAGSTFQGVAGWQAGNILTVAGASNGMAMSGAVFEFFDEGLRADPDATGVYGQYEVGEVDPVYRSERYWEVQSAITLFTYSDAPIVQVGSVQFKVRKCKPPIVSKVAGIISNGGYSVGSATIDGFRLSSDSVSGGVREIDLIASSNARLS